MVKLGSYNIIIIEESRCGAMRKQIISIAVVVGAVAVTCGFIGMKKNNGFSKYISSNNTVQINLVSPTSYKVKIQGKQGYETWVQLDRLNSHPSFRSDFDALFHINKVTINNINGKSGCLYVDKTGDRNGNTSFADAFRNKVFVEKYFNNKQSAISGLGSSVYSDISDEVTGISAALNAYYGLIADSNPDYFNGTASLTREQFYYLMYKENHGVNKDFLKDYHGNNDEFVKATSEFQDTFSPFAKQTAQYGFLQYKDGSLNKNIKASISRIEALYAVIQENFKAEYDKFVVDDDYGYKDVKNAGDIAGDSTSTKKWEQYLLAYNIEHHDKGMDQRLYKVAEFSAKYGLLGADDNGNLRWDEPLSKTEAIRLMASVELEKNDLYGYQSTVEYGKNNPKKFNAESDVAMLGGDLLLNPKVDEQGNVSGTNLNGEVAVSYSNDYILNQEKLHNGLTEKDSKVDNQKKDSTQSGSSSSSKKTTSSPSSGSSTKSSSGSTKKSSSSTKKSTGGGGVSYDGSDIPISGGGSATGIDPSADGAAGLKPGEGKSCDPGNVGLGGLH